MCLWEKCTKKKLHFSLRHSVVYPLHNAHCTHAHMPCKCNRQAPVQNTKAFHVQQHKDEWWCFRAFLIASNEISIDVYFYPMRRLPVSIVQLYIPFDVCYSAVYALSLSCLSCLSLTYNRFRIQGEPHYFLIAISLEMQFILHSLD